MARRVSIVLALLATSSLSCSVVFQNSVRSNGLYCSDSRFWYVSDFLIATAGVVALSQAGNDEAIAYSPAALFVGSGLIGVYKRRNCERYRKNATPEMWAAAHAAEQQRRDQEAARRAEWQAQQQQLYEQQQQQLQQQQQEQQQQPPPDVYQPEPQPQPQPQPRQPPPDINVQIERHASTDELGKSCSAKAGWPTAAECQYGAVCYANRCTVWCGNDGSCPSGYTCAFTDENPKTKLCRR